MESGLRRAEDLRKAVRGTYVRMVELRGRQLQYIAKKRDERDGTSGFVLSPDMVVQFNYVHRLMRSAVKKAVTDPAEYFDDDDCVEEGGITCANLSALVSDKTMPSHRPDEVSELLADRICDLLGRPVDGGDWETLATERGDEPFVDRLRSLETLFEERYRACTADAERLGRELSTARGRATDSSRSVAGPETVGDALGVSERDVLIMQERVKRLESAFAEVRNALEEARSKNDSVVLEKQRELERLLERSDRAGGGGDAFLQLFRQLFESLEAERDRLAVAIQTVRSVGDRTVRTALRTDGSAEAIEREVERRTGEQRRRLDAYRADFERLVREEANRITAAQPDAVDIQATTAVAFFESIDSLDCIPVPIQDEHGYLKQLDSVLQLTNSKIEFEPLEPGLAMLVDLDSPAMHWLCGKVVKLTDRVNETFRFISVQKEYIGALDKELDAITGGRMSSERIKELKARIDVILGESESGYNRERDAVLRLLQEVRAELPEIKRIVLLQSAESSDASKTTRTRPYPTRTEIASRKKQAGQRFDRASSEKGSSSDRRP